MPDQDHRDALAQLRREQRLFDAYLAGVRTGTRIPTGVDRDDFRQRVFAGWEGFADERGIGPGGRDA